MKPLLIGLCLLCPLTVVKISDVQLVEMFGLFCLFAAFASLCRDGLTFRAAPEILGLLKVYAIFLVAALGLAMWTLQYPTFPPPNSGLLKTAPFVSIARGVQLVVSMGTLTLLALAITRRPTLVNLAAQLYVYVGVACALYGVVSWMGLYAGVNLGGAYGAEFQPRARGPFVEGGPFGVYLVSVILMCIFRRRILRRGNPGFYWIHMGALFFALLVASSKAGILLALVLILYYAMLEKKLRYVVGLGVVVAPLFLFSNVVGGIQGYAHSYMNFDQEFAERADDPSLIMGRGMAMLLMPSMILDHPISGIGLGNYSLQRNNPEYLGNLPPSDLWDLPGLGLVGYTAELGLPLFLFACWMIWRPVALTRRAYAGSTLVVLLASYQFFAHMLGAQVTFMYPWIVSAIAIGYALTHRKEAYAAERTSASPVYAPSSHPAVSGPT
jgi:hypothetical protein